MPRRSARWTAGVVAVTMGLAACGSQHASPATDGAQARRTITTMLRDLADADGQAACERLTATGQASLIKAIGPELTNFGINDCAQVVHITGRQLSPKLRRELRHATVGRVAVHGSNAIARWSAITSLDGDLAAFFGHPKPVTLVEVDGRWLISGL